MREEEGLRDLGQPPPRWSAGSGVWTGSSWASGLGDGPTGGGSRRHPRPLLGAVPTHGEPPTGQELSPECLLGVLWGHRMGGQFLGMSCPAPRAEAGRLGGWVVSARLGPSSEG